MYAIISRKQAKEHGLSRYFTGKPCIHGHVNERAVSTKKCVQCNRDRVSKWQAANPDKVLANKIKNRVSLNASAERSKAKNPEKYKSLREAWLTKNRKRFNASVAAAKKKNPEKYRALRSAWEQKNKDKISAHQRNMGAIRRGASGKFTKSDVEKILKDQRKKCAYFRICGTTINLKDKYHVDHILAIARGGTNDRSNLQVLCPSCNMSKGAKDAMTFMRASGFLL